ncbi:unnamed protein product [Strongylus vulgaris]|uniref:Uncharacterized protein n=1 Tax=Strongylus vulgaris TaxID=40348 RepID=A0A3P7J0S3_STRVU|nr:unnamed protein product [Strongylus vulgaris]
MDGVSSIGTFCKSALIGWQLYRSIVFQELFRRSECGSSAGLADVLNSLLYRLYSSTSELLFFSAMGHALGFDDLTEEACKPRGTEPSAFF